MQGEPSLAIEVVEVVALPTTEPEYMVVVEVGKEIIWPRDFNSYLGMWQEQFQLHYDNQNLSLGLQRVSGTICMPGHRV